MPYEKVGCNKPVCIVDEVPFEIPDSWEWTKIESISIPVGNKANQILAKEILNQGKLPVVSQGKELIDGYCNNEDKKINVLPLVMFGDHTRNVKYIDFEFVIGADGTKFHKIVICNAKYIFYWMSYAAETLRNRGYARHYSLLRKCYIPLPPLNEQVRIVEMIEIISPAVDKYELIDGLLSNLNNSFPDRLRNSILQEAIQGKLVPQDPNDEPASVLLERIRKEKQRLIKEGEINKDKRESFIFRRDNSYYEKRGISEICINDKLPFDIPKTWEWVRLGSICEIARGASPRPIKAFLTNDPNGINWIKIGDTEKGGKHINSAKEKIIPEGVSKSRMVYLGDLLLTNSMSFGHPYILNIDGCIHDGWLVLSGYECAYERDFLFYMLSSHFAYSQFCDVVSGAVVKNLNSGKVAAALFPLPPKHEQKRIVKELSRILSTF